MASRFSPTAEASIPGFRDSLALPLLLPFARLPLEPPLLSPRAMATDALETDSWWVLGGAILGLLAILSLLWISCDKCNRRLSNLGYFSVLQQQRTDPTFLHQDASYVRSLPDPPSGSWMCAYKEERLSLCGWTWKSTATYDMTFRSKTGYFDGQCVDSKGSHAVLGVYNRWSGDLAWQVTHPWGSVEARGRFKEEQPGRITGRFVTEVGSQGSLELLALASKPDKGISGGKPLLVRKTGRPVKLFFRRPDSVEKACARCLISLASTMGRARSARLADRRTGEERPINIQTDLIADRQFNINAPESVRLKAEEMNLFHNEADAIFRKGQVADSDSETSSDDFKTWQPSDPKKPSKRHGHDNTGSNMREALSSAKKSLRKSSSVSSDASRNRSSIKKADARESDKAGARTIGVTKRHGLDDTDGAHPKRGAPKRKSKLSQGGLAEDVPVTRSRPRDSEREPTSGARAVPSRPDRRSMPHASEDAPARPRKPSNGVSQSADDGLARPRSASSRSALPSNARADSMEDMVAKRRKPVTRSAGPSHAQSDSSDDGNSRRAARAATVPHRTKVPDESSSKTMPTQLPAPVNGQNSDSSDEPTTRPRPHSARLTASSRAAEVEDDRLSRTIPARPAGSTARSALSADNGSRASARPERSAMQPSKQKWLEEDDEWPGTPAVFSSAPPRNEGGRAEALRPTEDDASRRPRTLSRLEEQAVGKTRAPSTRLPPPNGGQDEHSGSLSPLPRVSGRSAQTGSQRVRPASLRQPTKGDMPLDPEEDAMTNFRPSARTNAKRPPSQSMMV